MDYNTVSKQISDLVGNESANMDKQQQALQGQYGYQDAYNNLQGIRRNVSDTQSALNALPEQLQQRTAGSLTTAGQLGRLTATESDPIAKQLATLNSTQTNQQLALGDINKMIDTGMSRYQQSYTDQLKALQNQQSQLAAERLQQIQINAANQAKIDEENRQRKLVEDNQKAIQNQTTANAAVKQVQDAVNKAQQGAGLSITIPEQDNSLYNLGSMLPGGLIGTGLKTLAGGIGGGNIGAETTLKQTNPTLYNILKAITGKKGI